MLRKFSRPSLPTQIMMALVFGAMFGYFFPHCGIALKPLADVFLRMIRMIVVPLVFCALIVGVAGTGSFKNLGRLSLKSIIWFEVATTVALVIGLLVVNTFKPGVGVIAPHTLDTTSVVAASKKSIDILQILIEIVPTNIVDSMARGALLQVVFFSIFFGLAAAAAGKHGEPVVKLAENITNVMFRFTMFVMKVAPIGVFGAIAFSVGTYGFAMLLPLAKLLLCLYAGLIIFLILLLGGASLIWRVNFLHLLRAIKEPLLIAFSTCSSESAFPMLIERLLEFGVPRHIVMFVLPTGYSFNLDGGTLYLSMAVVFIAQVYGVPLSLSQQILILLTIMISSKGAAAIPGFAIVMIAGCCAAFGLPLEGVALIMTIDRLGDMGRTATNVIGNAVATIAVARWEKALPDDVLKNSYERKYGVKQDIEGLA
ncbi:MAG: cation:dicarboxylase symporter family transporter [Holophaga sp.]|nr:cation:dicarboxylase symporter family transporter [Holophaga sp.]